MLKNAFYFCTGLGFLTLAMIKHRIAGYRTPKPVTAEGWDGWIDHDVKIVDRWLDYAREYLGPDFDIAGKDVVELGPGSDLGNGLYLVARGANSYSAVDAIDNVSRVPPEFYRRMARRLAAPPIILQVDPAIASDPSRVRLYHSSDFDVADAVGGRTFDLVVSNAAFEHFDDFDAVLRDVAQILRPGGALIAGIDLITHSRWIRQKDPNNIYRYPDWLYRLFYFQGIPQRVRPHEYRAAAERHGLVDLRVEPLRQDPAQTTSGLARRFRGPDMQPDLFGIMLMARKPQDGDA